MVTLSISNRIGNTNTFKIRSKNNNWLNVFKMREEIDIPRFDHFFYESSVWEWSYSQGNNYFICPVTVDGKYKSVVEAGIPVISSDAGYHDASFHEDATDRNGNNIAKFNMRLNTTAPSGTWGAGMWNVNMGSADVIWFWYGGLKNTVLMRGLRAQVINNGAPSFNETIVGYDLSEWHTYETRRYNGTASFYIDSTLVAAYSTSVSTEEFRYETWIDNGYYNDSYTRFYMSTSIAQVMYVDWVDDK